MEKQEQYLDYRDVSHLLCLLLSSAENYALKNNPSKIFGYYDEYDNTNHKEDKDLYKQLLTEYECFRNAFFYYTKKYGIYEFPDKLEFPFIQSLVNDWKKFAGNEPLYDDILKILQQKETKSRLEDIKKLKNKVQNDKIL